MKINDLDRKKHANRRLGKTNPSRVKDIHNVLYQWFNGDFMPSEWGYRKNINEHKSVLLDFRELYKEFIPKRSLTLYRYRNTGLPVREGEKRILNTASRRIQSWTTNKKSAEKFYRESGYLGIPFESKTKPIIIKSIFEPKDIMVTIDMYYNFVVDSYLLDYETGLENKLPKEDYFFLLFHMSKNEREVVVDAKPRRMVIIEKIIRKK